MASLNLSNTIVQEFTKAVQSLTADQDVVHTIEGTIDSIDGDTYIVKLDGSTEVAGIPAESTVAAITNDRVRVSIQDHKAVIVGNLTDRSVGTITISSSSFDGGIITPGTLTADRVTLQGEDGLYYRINFENVADLEEDTVPYEKIDDDEYIEYEGHRIWTAGIDGRAIVAKTLNAEHMYVEDLSAFQAKIGGFNLNTTAIFTDGKETVGSDEAGLYLDKDGQFYLGDAENHIKFYKDQNENFIFDFVSQSQEAEKENQAKYIRFGGSEAAICIGELPVPQDEYIELRIDNSSGIRFVKSTDPDNPISSWTTDEFHAGNLVIDLDRKAQFGNFAFVPRSDGSLMFVKVGD